MSRDLVKDCQHDYHEYCVGDFQPDDIVISGMAGRFPRCDNVKEFKDGIYNKKNLLHSSNERFTKGSHINPFGTTGSIKNLDKFEVNFFNVSHNIINSMDPATRKLLEVTYEAIADAGYDFPSVYGANIGVYNANITNDSFALSCQLDSQLEGYTGTRSLHVNQITYFFNLLGPSMVIDAACSSSLSAFNAAYTDLKNGKIEGAIVNSSQINLIPEVAQLYVRSGIVSPTGRCAPFDASADGTVRSEGVVAIFLQKASTARRAYASVLSVGSFTSGFVKEGFAVPSDKMEENLSRHVLKLSGLHPDQIDFIEAHGTGTVVGDSKELAAIESVFCTGTRKKPIYIGSVKSNIGHTEASSGLSGIIKALLAMENGNIAPNYNFRNPNTGSKGLMNGSMKIVSEITPLISPYVTVSSFGIGGTLLQTVLRQNTKTYPNNYLTSSKIPRLALVSGTCEEATQFLIDYIKYNPDLPNEFFALLHKLSFCSPQLKPCRGYILSEKEASEASSIKLCTDVQRPVWFVYTGLGCQWKGMGSKLMQIDVFASSMRKCADVLKSHDLDLFKIISSDSDLLEKDRCVLPAFVSVAAIQISLTDLLHHIGIHPDGIIGHSIGEIGASYGDGCSSLEETMLLALYIGLCVDESPELARGSMVATGLTWKQALEQCPENVYAACHNTDNSVTISGLKDDVDKFAETLRKQNILATVVNSCGYAAHTKYMRLIADKLKTKKAIKLPKQRTKRWLSSSVSEADWEKPNCQIIDDDYFVNNIITTVKFNEVLKKISPNAITIEIAPHHLLQPILKCGINSERINLSLMKNFSNNVNFLLESIGKMYQHGLDPRVEKLYPAVQFPVPRNTPCISDLIKWNHSISFQVRKGEQKTKEISHTYNPSLKDIYLLDHFIDKRSIFPAAGYVVFAWKMLARKLQRIAEELPIIIQNFKIHRAVVIHMDTLKLSFNLLGKSFEIFERNSIVASGEIDEWDGFKYCESEPVYNADKESTVDGKDIYNDLRLKGYKYGPEFQAISKMSLDGTQYLLQWKDRWVPLLDACFQTFILANPDDLVLPTEIYSLKMDPNVLKQKLATDENIREIPVNFNRNTNICRSVGIEIDSMSVERANCRTEKEAATLEKHTFIPYEFQYTYEEECEEIHQYMKKYHELLQLNGPKLGIKSELNVEVKNQEKAEENVIKEFEGNQIILKGLKHASKKEISTENMHDLKGFGKDPLNSTIATGYALKIMLDIVAENTFHKLNVTEINSQCSPIIPHIMALAKKHPHLRYKNYTLMCDDEKTVDSDILNNLALHPLSSLAKLSLKKKEDVVVSSFYSGSVTELRQLVETSCSMLAKNGFIIFYHKEKLTSFEEFLSRQCGTVQSRPTLDQILQDNKLLVLSCARNDYGSALYLIRPAMPCVEHHVVNITRNPEFAWVEEIKKRLRQSDEECLWLVSEDDFCSGILGMVNCLKQEPGGERIRCVFVASRRSEARPPTFNFNHSFYKIMLAKNLVMNVWRGESWGSFRHIALPDCKEPRNVEHSYVRCGNYGDLSSIEWVESQVKYADLRENTIAHIYYSAINFRDVMLATGKLSAGAVKSTLDSCEDSLLGLEFSGRDDRGHRIAGITKSRGMATSTIINPAFLIDVPDEWSLEEAATVPVVYATAFYALVVRGDIRRGQSILIHSATGGVGLAATRIAIHYECEIFVTVGNEQKRRYLRRLFPQLKEENIGSSRNKSFEIMIKNRTGGKGVDIVLNSLADDKFQASVRCVATHGKFLEIGKYDLSLNRKLDMKVFLENISFKGIMLDALFDDTPRNRLQFSKIMDLLREGIKSGVVQPLHRSVFRRDEIEAAFRFMSRGIHVGKVLIEIRDEEPSKITPPKCLTMQAIPITYFYPSKSYIVIGGLGGFGMEVTKWILTKGGKNIFITSRRGVSTPHQKYWLNKWNRKGSVVQVLTLDVSKQHEAEQLLKEASKLSEIGGIFNSAVVLKDAFMNCQSPESFKDVCAPKAAATKILDELTRKMCLNLDFFICFSSVSSGQGNAGQTNYGYANSVMERICEERRKSGLHGLAIQWGIIGDVGLVHRNTKIGAGIPSLQAQNVQSCLETLDLFFKFEHPVLTSYVSSVDSKKTKRQTVDVFNQITKLIGMTKVTESFLNRTFGEIGIDSLLSVEIKQLIESKFDLAMTMQELYQMKILQIKKLSEKGAPPINASN